jgi:signal transduction histidine kinase
VVRHARATGCTVRIGGGDHAVTVSVEDDGIGVGAYPRGSGHGLDTIRERAEELGGEVRFESVDGTSVWASIPLQGSEE